MRNVIDGVTKIDFYLVQYNSVIASARLVFPFEPMPVLMAGFVVEYHRRKGHWNTLYETRLTWLKKHNTKAEWVYLYVHPDNPMKPVYESKGFEYTGEQHESGCDWMRLKLEQ